MHQMAREAAVLLASSEAAEEGVEVGAGLPGTNLGTAEGTETWTTGTGTETIEAASATVNAIGTGESPETSDPVALRSEEHVRRRETFEIEIETAPRELRLTDRDVGPEMEAPLPLVQHRRILSLGCLRLDEGGVSCVAVEEVVEEIGLQTEVEGGLLTTIVATATLEAVLRKGAGGVNETSATAVTATPRLTSDASLVMSATVANAT